MMTYLDKDCALLGCEREELLGRSLADLVRAVELVAWIHASAQRVSLHDSSHAQEAQVMRRDGTASWVRLTVTTVRDAGGELAFFVVLAQDSRQEQALRKSDVRISAGKQAESEREQLLARERSARADAERATRQRDGLLALVVHDLRNPVNTVTMTAELMREVEMDDSGRKHHLEVIERAALNMAGLITDLLDVTTIDSGRFAIAHARVDVPLLIRHAVDDFQAQAVAKGVVLQAEIDGGLPPVSGDAKRLARVLANLLSNALKFSPPDARIRLHASHRQDEIEVSVEDSGPGMSPAMLLHVFDRFWHAERDGRAGSGLGLYICKGIIEAHGGRISVESTPGAGSAFHFSLPC